MKGLAAASQRGLEPEPSARCGATAAFYNSHLELVFLLVLLKEWSQRGCLESSAGRPCRLRPLFFAHLGANGYNLDGRGLAAVECSASRV